MSIRSEDLFWKGRTNQLKLDWRMTPDEEFCLDEKKSLKQEM